MRNRKLQPHRNLLQREHISKEEIVGFFSEDADPVLKAAIQEFERTKSKADAWSDCVAGFAGSWRFIWFSISFLSLWILSNKVMIRPFDPSPYILLNLILSLVAMIQNPIIMLAQNRKEAKDRVRAEHHYRVNFETQQEISKLSVKMDVQQQNIDELSRLVKILIAREKNFIDLDS